LERLAAMPPIVAMGQKPTAALNLQSEIVRAGLNFRL